MDLRTTDLSQGYDYNAVILASPDGANPPDSRLGRPTCSIPGSPAGSASSSRSEKSVPFGVNALNLQSPEGAFAYDPRYGLDDLFNPLFSGRLVVKILFVGDALGCGGSQPAAAQAPAPHWTPAL